MRYQKSHLKLEAEEKAIITMLLECPWRPWTVKLPGQARVLSRRVAIAPSPFLSKHLRVDIKTFLNKEHYKY